MPVGGTLKRYGVNLVCIPRPQAGDLLPSEACRGCWLSKARRMGTKIMNCMDIQCSAFDRMDRRNVWFVREGEVL